MGFVTGTAGSLHAGTWVWWVESNRVVGNAIIADLFEIDRDSLAKGVSIETIQAAVHPDDLDSLMAKVQTAIDDQIPYQTSFRVRGREGRVRSVVSFGQCFFEDGRLVQFAGTTIETSTRQQFGPTLDKLIEQVGAAYDTARALGDPLHVRLLEMVLTDIGKAEADGLKGPAAAFSLR